MQNYFWIGARESDIKNEKIFSGSITRYGIESSKNKSFPKARQKNEENEYFDFISSTLQKVLEENQNCKFIFSNANTAYKMPDKILEHCICLNSFSLIAALNDKFFVRQFLSDVCNIPPNIITNGKLLKDNEFIKKVFNNKYEKFVGQKSLGGGGRKTFFIDEIDKTSICNDENFIITPYYKNNIPINVHCIIYGDDILILPPSIQIIINKFRYIGADFFTTSILSFESKIKLFCYAQNICKKFQKLGVRGILGLDFLYSDNDFLFLESNFRFQGSSFLLNMGLQELDISLYEQYINSFNQMKCNVKKDIFFTDINLSFYKITNKLSTNLSIEPILINLDGYSDDLVLSENAYKFNKVYNTSIINFFL